MKRLLRSAIPLAIMGTALAGVATPAQAGTWIYASNAVFMTRAFCQAAGPDNARYWDASAWTCVHGTWYSQASPPATGWRVRVYID